MANIEINQLPAGTLPLTGTEILPVDQGATTVQITIDDVVDYVYENGPTLDQVLDAGATSTTPITIGSPSEFTTINPGIIDVEYGAANVHTQYRPDGIGVQDLGGSLDMNIAFNNNNQNITFPAQSGTLALTSQLPIYKSYVALIDQAGASAPTAIVLQNTMVGAVTLSNPTGLEGFYRISCPDFIYTKMLVLMIPSGYGTSGTVISATQHAGYVDFSAQAGLSGAVSTIQANLEIRVYP
jgi:hypothetical protein